LILQLSLDSKYVECSERIFSPRIAWAKASDGDRLEYRDELSLYLHDIALPVDALLCNNATCHNNANFSAKSEYANSTTEARIAAG
jgi:hypothetical protein